MSEIVFPEGFNPNYMYTTPADFIPDYVVLPDAKNLYRFSNNPIIDVRIDTSNATNATYMFANNSVSRYITYFDTSNVISMQYMFYSCSKLLTIPALNTAKVTSMENMFSGCTKLLYIPIIDTSNVANMSYMFQSCAALSTIPELDFSKVTNMGYMFYDCGNLIELPNINCKKNTAFSHWLYNCKLLSKIGVIDCDAVTNIQYIIGNAQNNNLTDIGGFRNLGMKSSVSNTNGNYALYYAPNLTRQSLLNVFNLLYDRATAGYSVLTLKLHPNALARLSADDIAIATNKGWTIA